MQSYQVKHCSVLIVSVHEDWHDDLLIHVVYYLRTQVEQITTQIISTMLKYRNGVANRG